MLPSSIGISEGSIGSGSGDGIRCVTDEADTDFLDRRVCFGFTGTFVTCDLGFKFQSNMTRCDNHGNLLSHFFGKKFVKAMY